ncbi:glycosyltransferase [Acidomonas methanolica]|uniref:Glycosyl transferase n=2 Tax=Acidomonas methanolica TaxID=437 RepID=A0A023D3I3_ACIMT|nr:glycosyltransferase [Acidomonas methanolica]TCS30888.1 glycosyltransferase involved in cell wall biosynthesis [Acidomonas methanolica]GAJ28703.1 glycosyl transferase [Acidomonas methanolica NBRC 104435]GBQ45733.1 glycosyltransferase [Acidomonas methanolica]GEK98315.1 hypothetical protein AME01nite_08140 [Acidomonas methanolica NBRC 104435]
MKRFSTRPEDDGRRSVVESGDLDASYRAGSIMAGLRTAGLRAEIDDLRHLMMLRERSLSWRITAPLRWVRSASLGRLPSGRPLREAPSRLVALLRQGGIAALPGLRHFRGRAKRRLAASTEDLTTRLYGAAVAPQKSLLSPHVVIIAELSLPQCAKYRVWQKRDFLESLGWRVSVVDWRQMDVGWAALQCATEVVFYRTPAFDSVAMLVAEAHRLGLRPRWEVDDLIFDASEYRQNGNIASLPDEERDLLLFGVRLFRACLLACGRGIASTPALADAMRAEGVVDVAVIENALDGQTIDFAEEARRAARRDGGVDRDRVWVCYGSGTNTHDADFLQAVPGLLEAMAHHPALCLRVFGEVTVPAAFERFGDRVERRTGLDYRRYLHALAETDIAIAPLEATTFNDAKSNIKYLEASILGLPSVCSPRAAFRVILTHEENGYFAETDRDWAKALGRLAVDADLRRSMGERARRDVLARYAPDAVAARQVLPVFGPPGVFPPEPERLRVAMVNVYFKPRSFGGATIIVEEMSRRLRDRSVTLAVFTAAASGRDGETRPCRYRVDGIDVMAVPAAPDRDALGELDNPDAANAFAEWVEAFRPDLVHLHAAQGLGAGLLRVCEERGIPYVVTVHDAWWLCDRQFMVRADGRYCFQTTIDPRICQQCEPFARHLTQRAAIMGHALRRAALILSPSETHRQLYLANGVPPERIVVNRNGFRWPERVRAPRPLGAPLRFGFVGGTENIKGYQFLRQAVARLDRADWSLAIVDNKLNLGIRSIDPGDWRISGTLQVLPAYTQETMDDFYDGIDVLLFPSQWKESFGLTVREALARDVWVIATAPGGQAEPIEDGVNGTLIPLDASPEALTAAMTALLEQAARFEHYRNPLKDRLSDYETQADELLEIYRRILN